MILGADPSHLQNGHLQNANAFVLHTCNAHFHSFFSSPLWRATCANARRALERSIKSRFVERWENGLSPESVEFIGNFRC